MKRLCIYVIYDKQNIVDGYVGHILDGLKGTIDFLVVVYNGTYIARGKEILNKYADLVICRENKGLDAGGYKDALIRYIGWKKAAEYDELLLMNNSFYGFFYSINKIFSLMDTVKTDYWGMTRSQAGTIKGKRQLQYREHIQSYFLVFRNDILTSKVFKMFWEQLEYPTTMDEAIEYFELGINNFLWKNGFRGSAVSDLYQGILFFREDENPYLKYPLELIRDCKIPILKYKALSFRNSGYASALRAYRFIEENNLYNAVCIKKHFIRKSKFEEGMINFELLEEFHKSYRRIFIYGYGTYGRNLGCYFFYRGWKIEGYIVTSSDREISGVVPFEQAGIRKDDGIVIAVGREKVCRDILNYLEDKCKKEQLLFPNYNFRNC